MKYCIDLWQNKKIPFKSIVFYYYENDVLQVQEISSEFEYPSQYWFADQIIVTDKAGCKTEFKLSYITISYGKPYVIVE